MSVSTLCSRCHPWITMDPGPCISTLEPSPNLTVPRILSFRWERAAWHPVIWLLAPMSSTHTPSGHSTGTTFFFVRWTTSMGVSVMLVPLPGAKLDCDRLHPPQCLPHRACLPSISWASCNPKPSGHRCHSSYIFLCGKVCLQRSASHRQHS